MMTYTYQYIATSVLHNPVARNVSQKLRLTPLDLKHTVQNIQIYELQTEVVLIKELGQRSVKNKDKSRRI